MRQAGLDNYMVPQTLWTGSVDFTKIRGKHQLSFGFMDVWARIDGGHYANTVLQFQTTSTAGPDPQNATAGTGDGFASFLMGVGSGTDQTGFNKFPATDKNLFGWYLQDDWKINPKLTVNLGLRYEIQTAPTERTQCAGILRLQCGESDQHRDRHKLSRRACVQQQQQPWALRHPAQELCPKNRSGVQAS